MDVLTMTVLLILIGLVLVLLRQSIVLTRLLTLMDEDLMNQKIMLIEMNSTLDLIYDEIPEKE